MSDPNDRELQGLIARALPGNGESCVLQMQRQGFDLVFRIRFPIRLGHSRKGPMLTVEDRITNGLVMTRQEIMAQIEGRPGQVGIVRRALVMAFAEVESRRMRAEQGDYHGPVPPPWPQGWPVPTPPEIEAVARESTLLAQRTMN